MKYSIILPHWERAELLRHTLQSFRFHYADRTDFEVVVVEDSKNTDDVHGVVRELRNDLANIEVVRTGRKDGYNPAPAFNAGVRAAMGKYVLITNPECLHFTNVLGQLDEVFEFGPDVYAMCACMSIQDSGEFTRPEAFNYTCHLWYQHTKHRNCGFHFLAALSREQYLDIGGFDERYADGIAYDDNAWRDRVERAGIPFVFCDDIVAMHQWHGKLSKILPRAVDRRLRERNRLLYEADCKRHPPVMKWAI